MTQFNKTRSPLQAAFTQPLSLAMLGLAVLAGLIAAWWMTPIGIVLWIVMILAVATDPSLRFSLGMEDRSPLAQRFQSRYKQIQRAEAGIYNTLNSSGRRSWRRFQNVMETVHTISNRAHALSLRMSALENHRLVTASNRDFKAEMRMLDVQIEAAANDSIRREYEEQREDLNQRIQSLKKLETVLDRVEAELRSISSELETAHTRVIHLKSLGASEIKAELPGLISSLKELESELIRFDQETRSSAI